MLTLGVQPTYKLRPYLSRAFAVDELEGFRVEFHLGPTGEMDELFFHLPNGTFVRSKRRLRRLAGPRLSHLSRTERVIAERRTLVFQ
jgi:hypothetical protein